MDFKKSLRRLTAAAALAFTGLCHLGSASADEKLKLREDAFLAAADTAAVVAEAEVEVTAPLVFAEVLNESRKPGASLGDVLETTAAGLLSPLTGAAKEIEATVEDLEEIGRRWTGTHPAV